MALRIAVINDDPTFLELMNDLLRLDGYEVLLLHESSVAIPHLKDWTPAAIILGLRRDDLDSGWLLLAAMRAVPGLQTVPVVVCSADVVAREKHAEHLARAACAALPKPFTGAALRTLLTKLVPSESART